MERVGKLRCQRIGCDAVFSEDDNLPGSCRYHASGPIFHDGMKEWSCCKERSHDFNSFLEIPGCTVGVHTTEKPVVAKPATAKPVPKAAPSTTISSKDTCSRCRQGFFCSEHGSQIQLLEPHAPTVQAFSGAQCNSDAEEQVISTPAKKIADINEPCLCKHNACGITFKEKDNHSSACNYHPGPAVFHDGMKGWKCCDIHEREFDAFMDIPPCAKGWHES